MHKACHKLFLILGVANASRDLMLGSMDARGFLAVENGQNFNSNSVSGEMFEMSGMSKKEAREWMQDNVSNCVDNRTDEVNCTQLAEECCHALGCGELEGPLDDPDHWVWDLSVDVGEAHEKETGVR